MAHCRASGVADARVIPIAVNDYANGYAAAVALAGVDGLFCVSDYVACGVIDALRNGGAVTPRIIGHDDIPQAGWTGYGLTTIAQPCDEQARRAIDLLVSRMDVPDLDERTEITPVILVRRDTA